MRSKKHKLPTRIKINIAIIFATSMALFVGSILFYRQIIYVDMSMVENLEFDEKYIGNPAYEGSYPDGTPKYESLYMTYRKYDICPCRAGETNCEGTFLCPADEHAGRVALTYNLDNAPADLLEKAEKEVESEERYWNLYDAVNRTAMPQKKLYVVVSAMMKVLSLVGVIVCVVYYNHEKTRV